MGRPATVPLPYLIGKSPVIGVCHCVATRRIGGMRFAEVAVERSFKGCQAGQRFLYLAERTWTCDITDARGGERALLLLTSLTQNPFSDLSPDFTRHKREFEKARRHELRGVSLSVLTHSGNGRMPIVERRGASLIRRSLYIRYPDDLPEIHEAGQNSWMPGLSPLELTIASVKRYIASPQA